MFHDRSFNIANIALALALSLPSFALATTISIDPTKTYLRTSNDTATAATAINLSSYGLSAGDTIKSIPQAVLILMSIFLTTTPVVV